MVQQPLVSQGLLIIKASGLYLATSHSVGLLWTSYQPTPGTSTWQHTTLTREPGPSYYQSFRIIFSNITLGRTPLDELSTHRRYLYLTTHNTHKTETSMLLEGLEHAFPASERTQTKP